MIVKTDPDTKQWAHDAALNHEHDLRHCGKRTVSLTNEAMVGIFGTIYGLIKKCDELADAVNKLMAEPPVADKEAAVPQPYFTVTVIPAEETLEAYLMRTNAYLHVARIESANVWRMQIPRVGVFDVRAESLEEAVADLCRALSANCSMSVVSPGDIVYKIMASLPSTSR